MHPILLITLVLVCSGRAAVPRLAHRCPVRLDRQSVDEELPKGMDRNTVSEERSAGTQPPSIVWVLAATVIAGISGYFVIWLVARTLGAADYSVFGVFWSGLFLVVGVLFGVQQEMTRATADALHRRLPKVTKSSLFVFAGALAIAVGVVVSVSALWWAPRALGIENAGLSTQIAWGAAANAVVATVSGLLAGAQLWRHLGSVIAGDGLLRVLLVLMALSFSTDPSVLAWAVILPFPLALGVIVIAAPRTVIRLGRSDLSYRQLVVNSGHTVLAASATALIINGFPLVLAFFAKSDDTALLGALILAITITRAPILVPLMALQSYLVTRFTGATSTPWILICRAFSLIGIAMLVLALATFLWGTASFEALIGSEFALSTSVLVPLVVSSGFIGGLCVTGPALLAQGAHRSYAMGWVLASLISIGMLYLPVGLGTKAALALSVGPVMGLCAHLVMLWRAGFKRGASVRLPARR